METGDEIKSSSRSSSRTTGEKQLQNVKALFSLVCRVRMGPGKPGKSWNFNWHFPGLESPGKMPLVLESSGNL